MKFTKQLSQIKATQKHTHYAHGGARTEVLTFAQWVNRGFELLEERGSKIESTDHNGHLFIQITHLNQKPIIVTEDELRADYKRCYLNHGANA